MIYIPTALRKKVNTKASKIISVNPLMYGDFIGKISFIKFIIKLKIDPIPLNRIIDNSPINIPGKYIINTRPMPKIKLNLFKIFFTIKN